MSEDVEVVVTGLPEGAFREASGDRDFDCLKGFRERIVWRFVNEEMDVLGHDYVAEDFELVMSAGAFERVEEDVP